MKARFVYTLFLAVLAALTLTANKSGRASAAGIGNTGAPGDDASPNGTPRTCSYCHAGGNFNATITIALRDSTGASVSTYQPGQVYTLRIATNASGSLPGYGFQAIGLRNSDNSDLDGFSDPGNNNYKIATIANGRTYAEHDNISNDSVFNVRFTAPPAGTGSITFYTAANVVNRNGFTSGDQPLSGTLTVLENGSTAVSETVTLGNGGNGALKATVDEGGSWRLRVFDLGGRLLIEKHLHLVPGVNTLALPTDYLPAGVAVVQLARGQKNACIKVLF